MIIDKTQKNSLFGIIGVFIILLFLIADSLESEKAVVLYIVLPALIVALYFYNKISYFIDEGKLYIRTGFIYHQIDSDKIISLTRVHTANMKKNKIEIEYEGGTKFIYLKNSKKFIDHLLFLNPAMLIK